MSDFMRERHLAARKALKGDEAAAPTATRHEATVQLDQETVAENAALQPNEADNQIVEDFLRNTKNAGPFPYSPFRFMDVILICGLLLCVYLFVWHKFKIDVLPYLWHRWLSPHYDYHDDPNWKPPEIDVSAFLGDL